MSEINENELNETVEKTVSSHDLIMYLDNHDNYILGRGVSAFVGALMAAYMLNIRQDPIIFTILTCIGVFLVLIALFESAPLLMMEREYEIAMRDWKEKCPPLQARMKSVSHYLLSGTIVLFAAMIMGLAMELPYM